MIFVHTLGTALIDVGEHTVRPTSPRKFALLLYLVVERGRLIPRSTLQELIFPDQADRNARHSLRELIYQLRQIGVEVSSSSAVVGIPRQEVHFDCDQITSSDTIRLDSLRRALGGFLPGFAPCHSEAYAEWYDAFRARSLTNLSRALLDEVNRAKSCGEWDATEWAARACLAFDPLNEAATLSLAEMLVLSGAKAKAVQLLDDFMGEVGRIDPELKIPAKILRRRIDQAPDGPSSRGVPRFVGRSDEMNMLRQVLRQACKGDANLVVVSGEAGIGKSRLLSEFRAILELEGGRCQSVSMQAHDANRPMGAFVDLVPALLQMPGALGCSPDSMHALKRLVGESVADRCDGDVSCDLDAIELRTITAIGDLCESIASESPLVLVLEDVHFLDQFSIGALSSLISLRASARVLLLVTTREPRPLLRAIRHADRVHQLVLRPLSNEATHALIEDLVSPNPLPDPHAWTRLAEAAHGNPLFAVLLASQYRETGDHRSVPSTLIESLARRLEPLSNAALGVLNTCIALGKHCTTDRLIRALEITPASLLETIAELADAGLLDARAEHVSPAHPLIGEVLASVTLPAMRTIVNFRAAEVFEKDAQAGGSPAHWWEAGVRWREAGDAERALLAFRQCAAHAVDIGRPADAAHMLNEALLTHASDATMAQAARELMISADLAAEGTLVLRGQEILRQLGIPCAHDDLELAGRRASCAATQVPDSLFDATRECLRSASATSEHQVRAAIVGLKGADLVGTADVMATLIEREMPRSALTDVSLAIRMEFELLLRSARDDRQGAAALASALLAASTADRPVSRIAIQHNCGIAFLLAGNTSAAIAAWESAFETASSLRSPSQQVRTALLIAGVYADLYEDSLWDVWLAKANEAEIAGAGVVHNFELPVMQLYRSAVAGDLVEVESILRKGDEENWFAAGETRQRWALGFKKLLKIRKGIPTASDDDAARAVFAVRDRSISGIRDFEIAVAGATLGFRHRSEAICRMYLYLSSERRTQKPVDRLLSQTIRELENDQLHRWQKLADRKPGLVSTQGVARVSGPEVEHLHLRS